MCINPCRPVRYLIELKMAKGNWMLVSLMAAVALYIGQGIYTNGSDIRPTTSNDVFIQKHEAYMTQFNADYGKMVQVLSDWKIRHFRRKAFVKVLNDLGSNIVNYKAGIQIIKAKRWIYSPENTRFMETVEKKCEVIRLQFEQLDYLKPLATIAEGNEDASSA